jgi:hypothetical protein
LVIGQGSIGTATPELPVANNNESLLTSDERPSCYQLDLITPGSSPFRANDLKHIRQMPNFLINALGRPQIGHLEYARVEKRGLRLAFTIKDFFAKNAPFLRF